MTSYNVEDLWDKIHIWIKLDRDYKAGQWVNINCFKNQIKDRTLDDDVLINNC